MSDEAPRGFVRAEGAEEITPPISHRVSSFDSLSAARALCSQLPVSPAPAETESAAETPGSPTVAAAAAALHSVQSSDVLEGAVDCLMSMSSHAATDTSMMMPPKKRPAPASDAAPASRRKLKMRAGPSPLSRGSGFADSYGSTSMMQPLSLLSSSNVDQLKLLAAAFKLCPSPTDEQLAAIASRVGMEADSLGQWFHQRRVLQEWVQQQPHVNSSSIRSMFYGEGDGQNTPPDSMVPPPAPWHAVNAS